MAKYLGVDFGLKRIGLAISEGEIASPYQVVTVKNFSDGVEKILQIIKKEGFETIVVGLPEGKIGQTVVGFIKALRNKGLEVLEADETLSSKRAITQMISDGTNKKSRKLNDDTAAAIILQDWLDLR